MPTELNQPIPVASWRQPLQPTESHEALPLVRGLAWLLDSAVPIPGTRFRVGIDAILGLIPGIGDAASAAIGSVILLTAARLGVPRVVLARMLMNLGADALTGVVPVVGDVVDAAWRANTRNVALLEQALLEPQVARRRSVWTLVALGIAVFALAAGGAVLTFFVARAVWQAVF